MKPRFKVWRHTRWFTVALPSGFLTVVYRKGWRKAYAYWSPNGTPRHECARWLWGRRNYGR